MDNGWRELSTCEIEVIKRMTGEVSSQFTFEPNLYVGKPIDEFGSLALCRREDTRKAKLTNTKALVSAYFDDDNNKDIMGPLVHLIIFWNGVSLRELQIYRDDGGLVRRKISPEELFDITPEGGSA